MAIKDSVHYSFHIGILNQINRNTSLSRVLKFSSCVELQSVELCHILLPKSTVMIMVLLSFYKSKNGKFHKSYFHSKSNLHS